MAEKKYLDQEGLAKLWELISDTFEDSTAHDLDIEELRDLINEVDAKTDAGVSEKVDALEAKIDANKEETDAAIDAKFAEIVDGAPEALNTLKEIAEYIGDDDTRTIDIIERVNDLEQIKALTEDEIEAICERVSITTKVADVTELKAALEKGGIVKLTEDMTISDEDQMVIAAGQNATLDLAGHTITANRAYPLVANGGELVITGDGEISGRGRLAAVQNGGKLTIEGGLIKSTGDVAMQATGAGSQIEINDGQVEAQEFGALVTTGAELVMNGGTVEAFDNAGIGGNGTAGQGEVNITINGGDIISNIQSAGYVACGIYMPNSGTLTINGGNIIANGGAGVVCRGGVTNINGGTITTTAHPTLTEGKVGDARQVVPCVPVVYDKNSKYPAMDSLAITIGADAVLNSATDQDIAIISDEEEPKVTDLRA